MLKEIRCDKFKSNGRSRPPIVFNDGLNVILGSKNGDNSIGKSTFLMIIDYAFGGNSYGNSSVIKEINEHIIQFEFIFGGVSYYFSRFASSTKSKNNFVYKCDSNYNQIEKIKIDDYRLFLKNNYGITLPYISFRDIVGLFFRIYGKNNNSEIKALTISGEKHNKSIHRLEKLFGKYDSINTFVEEDDSSTGLQDAYKELGKNKYYSASKISSETYNHNLEQIELYKKELEALRKSFSKKSIEVNVDRENELGRIEYDLSSCLKQRRIYNRKLFSVKDSLNIKYDSTLNNINELAKYFDNLNLTHIQNIEEYHKKITVIIERELKSEKERLEKEITLLDSSINELNKKKQTLLSQENDTKNFFTENDKILSAIQKLEAENATYEVRAEVDKKQKNARTNLETQELPILRDLETIINSKIEEFNDYIYLIPHHPPVLDLKKGRSYNFSTPTDTGAGTQYKNLIILDLAILSLTQLPCVIHDSNLLKNIGDASIEKIFDLYLQTNKQVFISIDKQNSYYESSQKLINDFTVLRLNENGDELFGYDWAKK